MNLKYELQNLISGVSAQTENNLIQAAANNLRKSEKTSCKSEKTKFFTKDQEAKELILWVDQNDLWFKHHDESRFIAQGAEQRVYLNKDERTVYKLNDSIFYEY